METIFDFEKAKELKGWFERVNRVFEANRLTVICAWCQKTLSQGGPIVSHGICDQCNSKHFAGL